MKADARSVKMDRVDDNYIVRINITALIYLLTLVASASYYWLNTQSKIPKILEIAIVEPEREIPGSIANP